MTADAKGLGPDVTRRDFVNTALVGAGAALLDSASPAATARADPAWTGYGGIGDYRAANGNTADVVEAAHRIRDHLYDGTLRNVIDTGEQYDVVVVGGGFAGLGAAHEFAKRHPGGKCLLLDNQPVFGGFAKCNEFDVDGYRVAGPQASVNFILPTTPEARANGYWDELGLPESFRFAERAGGDPSIKFQQAVTASLYHGEQCATVGYRFEGAPGGWVKDIWDGDLARAPWPAGFKRGLLALRDYKRRATTLDPGEAARLDRITFADFAMRELGVSADVLSYITLGMCITGPQISAYAARSLPGLDRFPQGSAEAALGERFVSFPGGNTVIARHFVKALVPDAIAGPRTFAAIANGRINFGALDRPDAACRIRLDATAVRVSHMGDPATAGGVEIVYAKRGGLHRVRARAAVMTIGAWVTKYVVAGLPAERRAVLDQFLYAPMLVANVALRNWRFLDRLGFSTARWFEGFGFYCSIRRPMLVDERAPPFHPDKPIVMTFYVPIQSPDLPLEAQGPAGRFQLYGTSYADYERRIVRQMERLFASGGFDAPRDIAGIVLNRWGHAFVSPPPGFFFGKDGAPSPLKVASEPWGRIAFGQNGLEDWIGAAHAGRRAIADVAHLF